MNDDDYNSQDEAENRDQRRQPGEDPLATTDGELGDFIAETCSGRGIVRSSSVREARRELAENDPVFQLRKALIEGKRSDPFGFERLIGKSDLLSINFLDRGRRSADAVCRIKLPVDGGHAFGTGFLVGPRLLLTNNHVLAGADEAAQAEAEFGYDHDLDGVVRQPVQFNLDPHQLFITDPALDITLVAVTPISESGVPLDRYGWLPLLPVTGKVVDGEWVTIVQHPHGQPKQIAIHASQVIKLPSEVTKANLAHFIHYSTDTEPGSSGSPVFNDQWQVIALHHKAVPDPKTQPGDAPVWIANEGVRVSAIFNYLERNRFDKPGAQLALDRIARGFGFPPLGRPMAISAAPAAEQSAPFAKDRWKADDLGYNPNFLTTPIPLAPIYKTLAKTGKLAPLLDGSGHELRYFHFSSVMSAERRFPILTVVNIDGGKMVKVDRKDTWRLDGRVDAAHQSDDQCYKRTLGEEKVYFSRGHMVRLLDPCWSDASTKAEREAQAKRGMADTFHFTNAAPQFQTYNDQDWGNLEDYLLDKAMTDMKRMTVFTGPIFRDEDPMYGSSRTSGPWRIPLSFWKIAILQKTDDRIAAAAFVNGQTEYVRALYESKVFSGLKPYSIDELRSRKIQTTIAAVEDLTGLDFGALKEFDAHGSLESTRRSRWFNTLDDIAI